MKKISLWCSALLLVLCAACSKYDDSGIWDSLNSIKARVDALETTVGKLNGDLAAMQMIVDKLNAKVYVSKVETNSDGSYTIYFTDNNKVTIRNGKDGSDAPVIGVKADADGYYYWTLTADGKTDWLRDADKEKMRVTGEGATPQLKVDDKGFWIVSYDGWKSKQFILDEAGKPVSALGQDAVGDSFFKGVDEDVDNVYFTLMDGSVITVAKRADFYLLVKMAPVKGAFAFGETKTYEVESVGVVDIVLTKPFGWRVSCADGKFVVTAPAEGDMCEKEGEVTLIYFSADKRSSVVKMNVVIAKDDTGTTQGTYFSVTITEVGANTVRAEVTPTDLTMTYYIYPNMATQTDEECINQLKKRFRVDVEDGEPITYLKTGKTANYAYTSLLPNSEFTLSVIGVKYDAAAKTLEVLDPKVIMRIPFTTQGPDVINTTFLMTLTNVSWYGASCAIHPSDDLPYFHAFVKKTDFEADVDDASFAQNFIDRRYLDRFSNEIYEYGWEVFTVFGNQTLTTPGFLKREPLFISEDVFPLEPNTEYYAVAFGCNEFGEFSNAKVGRKLFRTKPFVPAEKCSFRIETSVEQQDIIIKVIPSDDKVSYISFIDERDSYSDNFDQPIQYPPYDIYWRSQSLEGSKTIGDSPDFYRGESNYRVVNLKASTAYIVYAYGCTASGVITTAPEIVEVVTRGTVDKPFESFPAKTKGYQSARTYQVIRLNGQKAG